MLRRAWAVAIRASAPVPEPVWRSPAVGGAGLADVLLLARRSVSTERVGGKGGQRRKRGSGGPPPTAHRKGAHLRGKDAGQGPPGMVYARPSTRRHLGDAKGKGGTGLFQSLGNRGPSDPAGPLSKGSGFAGRGWSASELRLATTEDLQKLWYVLLKERNSLFAEQKLYDRANAIMLAPHRFELVRKSMARIKLVIGERMYAEPDPVRRRHLKSFLT